MNGLEALQAVQFVTVKDKRLAVLSADDWEALVEWLEDAKIARQALDELNAAQGDRRRAGWLEWADVEASLPDLLVRGLRLSPLPADVYRYVLDFLAGRPTPEEVAAFRPTPEMIERRRTLVAREHANEITDEEKAELNEYDRIEHLVIMFKTGNLPFLTSKP